jgi:hypothetical protein
MSCTWKPANCSRGGADSTWSTIRTSNLACPVVHCQQPTPSSVQLPQHDGCSRTPPCPCCVCAALPPRVHRRASMPQGHARSAAAGPGTKHGIPPPHDADPTPPARYPHARRIMPSPLTVTAACVRAAGCLLARLACFVLGKLGWICSATMPSSIDPIPIDDAATIPFSLTRGALVPGTCESSVTEVG